ncbi:MAG: SDR family oxidoreductase [Alphaproteobacteria bacterium]|nr:SDR family oxidoreductase [Alphaproteobacteria bacterium]
MQLKDKVAVVTGAAQGIGLAIAERFAKEGAKVVLSDIEAGKGKEAADRIAAAGGDTRFVACDVGDAGQVTALVGDAVREYGRLDVMVSNAGTIHTAEFLDLEERNFDKVLRTNLKGSFLTGQAAARQMVAQSNGKEGDGGTIINMSSVNAILAIPNQVPYNVSKGGINQLTHVMALALAPHNIRVNAIGPGTIATEMAQVVMEDEAARKKIMSRTPMGRLGEPGEVAAVAVFLASAESSYISGQVIYCDGGRLPLNYTVPVE